jgi:hypothetical protein
MSATEKLIQEIQKLQKVAGSDASKDLWEAAIGLLDVVKEVEQKFGVVITLEEEEKSGLPSPAEHTIQARMADEKFGPPRSGNTLLSGTDVAEAIRKTASRKKELPLADDVRAYVTALEEENWALIQQMQRLEAMERAAHLWASLGSSLDQAGTQDGINLDLQSSVAECILKGLGPLVPEVDASDD